VDKVLHCECGFEARAGNEDGLAAEVQRHAREKHGMALSNDEARVLASRAELDESLRLDSSRTTALRQTDEEER
jgi:predicted small metal-binding protein